MDLEIAIIILISQISMSIWLYNDGRTVVASTADMIDVKPTIEWLPRLSPQLVGSASSNHYLCGRVARPLNGLPHKPLPYCR